MQFTIDQLKKTKICPCCNGKLKTVKKYGQFNLANKIMLECKICGSNF